MLRIRRPMLVALVLTAGLVLSGTASAGPIKDFFCPSDCPRSQYSPFRYWAPAAAHISDDIHGPKISVRPPDRHPEVPNTFAILKYHCPAVEPGATIVEPPTPPATSRFRY